MSKKTMTKTEKEICAAIQEDIPLEPRPFEKLAKKIGFKHAPLDYLFKNSDIITLHVPYNKATHHLINLETLKLFKKGCYLINTARGGICDTAALLEGLKQEIFAGPSHIGSPGRRFFTSLRFPAHYSLRINNCFSF